MGTKEAKFVNSKLLTTHLLPDVPGLELFSQEQNRTVGLIKIRPGELKNTMTIIIISKTSNYRGKKMICATSKSLNLFSLRNYGRIENLYWFKLTANGRVAK